MSHSHCRCRRGNSRTRSSGYSSARTPSPGSRASADRRCRSDHSERACSRYRCRLRRSNPSPLDRQRSTPRSARCPCSSRGTRRHSRSAPLRSAPYNRSAPRRKAIPRHRPRRRRHSGTGLSSCSRRMCHNSSPPRQHTRLRRAYRCSSGRHRRSSRPHRDGWRDRHRGSPPPPVERTQAGSRHRRRRIPRHGRRHSCHRHRCRAPARRDGCSESSRRSLRGPGIHHRRDRPPPGCTRRLCRPPLDWGSPSRHKGRRESTRRDRIRIRRGTGPGRRGHRRLATRTHRPRTPVRLHKGSPDRRTGRPDHRNSRAHPCNARGRRPRTELCRSDGTSLGPTAF